MKKGKQSSIFPYLWILHTNIKANHLFKSCVTFTWNSFSTVIFYSNSGKSYLKGKLLSLPSRYNQNTCISHHISWPYPGPGCLDYSHRPPTWSLCSSSHRPTLYSQLFLSCALILPKHQSHNFTPLLKTHQQFPNFPRFSTYILSTVRKVVRDMAPLYRQGSTSFLGTNHTDLLATPCPRQGLCTDVPLCGTLLPPRYPHGLLPSPCHIYAQMSPTQRGLSRPPCLKLHGPSALPASLYSHSTYNFLKHLMIYLNIQFIAWLPLLQCKLCDGNSVCPIHIVSRALLKW